MSANEIHPAVGFALRLTIGAALTSAILPFALGCGGDNRADSGTTQTGTKPSSELLRPTEPNATTGTPDTSSRHDAETYVVVPESVELPSLRRGPASDESTRPSITGAGEDVQYQTNLMTFGYESLPSHFGNLEAAVEAFVRPHHKLPSQIDDLTPFVFLWPAGARRGTLSPLELGDLASIGHRLSANPRDNDPAHLRVGLGFADQQLELRWPTVDMEGPVVVGYSHNLMNARRSAEEFARRRMSNAPSEADLAREEFHWANLLAFCAVTERLESVRAFEAAVAIQALIVEAAVNLQDFPKSVDELTRGASQTLHSLHPVPFDDPTADIRVSFDGVQAYRIQTTVYPGQTLDSVVYFKVLNPTECDAPATDYRYYASTVKRTFSPLFGLTILPSVPLPGES